MQNLYGPKLKPASNNQLFASAERVAAGNGDIVRTEWLAHISLDGSQIPGTFEVRMYLSDKTVGAVTSFGGAAKKSSIPISGTVPLTQALLDNGASDALATLRDFLTWKIMKVCNQFCSFV